MNNYERIKAMSLDEMAEHQVLFGRACIDGALQALNLKAVNYPPMEVSINNQLQWLQRESEEYEDE